MVCIYCSTQTSVTNSRAQKRSNTVWRRRSCSNCGATVTSIEKFELGSAIIVTNGVHHEPFSRDKLFISVHDSCKHRKTVLKDAVGLTDTIISKLYPLVENAALPRTAIIEQTIQVLTRFDKAAAIQYSAYHPNR